MTAKLVPPTALTALFLLLAALVMPTPCPADDFEIEIEVSPATINLSVDAEVLTVHTSIPYSDVVGITVSLFFGNADVPISWWKADDRGYFVAKFPMDAIRDLDEELEIPGENVFGIDGFTVSDDRFYGSDTAMVIDGGAKNGGSKG